jgi:hypothetical protein
MVEFCFVLELRRWSRFCFLGFELAVSDRLRLDDDERFVVEVSGGKKISSFVLETFLRE